MVSGKIIEYTESEIEELIDILKNIINPKVSYTRNIDAMKDNVITMSYDRAHIGLSIVEPKYNKIKKVL